MIEISQKYILEFFTYKDGNLYIKNKVNKNSIIGEKAGTICKTGYTQISINYKKYYLHRLIWLYHYGKLPEKQIDHINRNKSDNRIENLRECSQSKNLMNTRISKRNKSGIKGLSWCDTHQRWRVCLSINKKVATIGYFKDKELAELVTLEAFNKYYGEYNGYN